MAALTTTLERLSAQLRVLRQRWQETRTLWDDPVARRFEQNYWTPLDTEAYRTLQELDSLAQVLAQAKQHVK